MGADVFDRPLPQHLKLTWERIDHTLVKSKFALSQSEMSKLSEDRVDRLKMPTDDRNTQLACLVELHVRLTNEWLERLYQAYLETWTSTGREASPSFIITILHQGLYPLIKWREKEILTPRVTYNEIRNYGTLPEALYGSDGLLGEWWRRLAKEAVRCENRGSRSYRTNFAELTGKSVKAQRTGADIWRGLGEEFDRLRIQQDDSQPNGIEGRSTYLNCFVDERTSKWCFELDQRKDQYFVARFEALAARAGRALGTDPAVGPLWTWFYFLFAQALNDGDMLFPMCGTVLKVWVYSATVCYRLELEALRTPACETPQSPVMSVPEVLSKLSVGRSTVYRYIDDGRLKRAGLKKQPGKRSKVLILASSVEDMLKESTE